MPEMSQVGRSGPVLRAALALLLVASCGRDSAPGRGAEARGPRAGAPGLGRGRSPELAFPVRRGVSRPLSTMTAPPPVPGPTRVVPPPHLPDTTSPTRGGPEPAGPDPVLQDLPVGAGEPAPALAFDGLSSADNEATIGYSIVPPDPTGDVGPEHYVQWVNLSLAVHDKQGRRLRDPLPGNAPWQGFGGPCEETNSGDVMVVYDQLADRWVLSQFAITGRDGYQCFAVSKTPDPLGEYHLYQYLVTPGGINDFPKLALWPDGYYLTIQEYGAASEEARPVLLVFERDAMLLGLAAAMLRFELHDPARAETYSGVQAMHLEGRTAPAAGTPNRVVMAFDDEVMRPAAPDPRGDSYKLWPIAVDWRDPGRARLGDPVEVAAPDFDDELCDIAQGGCISQPGSDVGLDAMTGFTMHRLAYRADRDAVVVNHTVDADGRGRAGIRWAEIRAPLTRPVLAQTGTFAPDDGNHRWMGSLAMDAAGNIALGYSVSGPATFPSLRLAGRLADDPPGVLAQGEVELATGLAAQQQTRFGDYAAMSVDDGDDCTFWFTGEYLASTARDSWHTRVAAFSFPACTTAAPALIEGRVQGPDGRPIARALLRAGSLSTVTDAHGEYRLRVAAGIHEITAAAYGHATAVASIEVAAGASGSQQFTLAAAPRVLLSGIVRDGGAAGWPLGAELVFRSAGAPPLQLASDPVTGAYRVELVAGVEYELEVRTAVPGYLPLRRPVTPAPGDRVTLDLALAVDEGSCAAPGYRRETTPLVVTDFEGVFPPPGFTLENQSSGCAGSPDWSAESSRPNLTGGSGGFAIADSDLCGRGAIMDASLVSPVLDLSQLGSDEKLAVEFDHDFYPATSARGQVELWNGSEWQVQRAYEEVTRGPQHDGIAVAGAAGRADARLRWRFVAGSWEWWWQLDNIAISRSRCSFHGGGLLLGRVRDENTGAPVAGAVLRSAGGATAISAAGAREGATASGAGGYLLWVAESDRITATAAQYGTRELAVAVPRGTVQELDLQLPAGQLAVAPGRLALRVAAGQVGSAALALGNRGGRPLRYELGEIAAPPAAPPGGGARAPTGRRTSPKRLHAPTAVHVRVPGPPPPAVALPAGQVLQRLQPGIPGVWGIGHDSRTGETWLGSVAALGGDDQLYLLADRERDGASISLGAAASLFVADLAYNPRTGTLWGVNVGGDDCIHEFDPRARQATGRRICPGSGISQRGLAYDPVSDTYYTGSWNDQLLRQFDARGHLLRAVQVRLDIAGLAYNPHTRHLFVLTNSASPAPRDVYVLDAARGLAVLGAFDLSDASGSLLAPLEAGGLELDCEGRLWAVNQHSGEIAVAAAGELARCPYEVPWLDLSVRAGSVAAGAIETISLRLDGGQVGPGLHQAQLLVSTDTPYVTGSVPVDIVVSFADVDEGHPDDLAIHLLAGRGIAAGCDALHFCPAAPLTRGAAAAWLLGARRGGAHPPLAAPATGDAAYLAQLQALGVPAACEDGSLCPERLLAELARWLLLLTGAAPGATEAAWLQEAERRGWLSGCGDAICADAPPSRGAVASAVVRAFALP